MQVESPTYMNHQIHPISNPSANIYMRDHFFVPALNPLLLSYQFASIFSNISVQDQALRKRNFYLPSVIEYICVSCNSSWYPLNTFGRFTEDIF